MPAVPVVLVVDDDPSIRLLFISAFQEEGFAVREARDGIEAIESCEDDVPDLMILDLNMPRLDGVALLEELEQRGWRRFPVMAVTAQPRRAGAVAGRVDDLVIKPVDLDELLSRAIRLIHPSHGSPRTAGREDTNGSDAADGTPTAEA